MKSTEVEYDDFDDAFKIELFSPKNIIELDTSSNNITISSSARIHLKQFMAQVVQKATARAGRK